MEFQEKLEGVIGRALDRFQANYDAKTIASKLMENGCESEALLEFLEISDLTQAGLPVMIARAVRTALQSLDINQAGSSGSSETGQSRAAGSTAPEGRQITNSLDPLSDFRIDWNRIYFLKNKKFFDKGKQPDSDLRKAIVKECILQIKKVVPEPTRDDMRMVYDKLTARHPESFQVKLPNGRMTASSLRKQLMDGRDNCKRPGRNDRQRKPSQVEYEQPKGKFSYGCVRWRAQDLPDGQTEQTIQDLKERLKTTFQEERPRNWNIEEIKECMTLTYKLQRELINTNIEQALNEEKEKRYGKRKNTNQEDEDDPQPVRLTIQDIRNSWPFLFQYPGMSVHFSILTEVEGEKLQAFLETKMGTFIKYFRTLNTKKKDKVYNNAFVRMKREKQREPNHLEVELKGFLTMLANFFGEDVKDLIHCDDALNGFDDIQHTTHAFPGLIAEGRNVIESTRYHLCADAEPLTTVTSFKEAVGLTFMAYYVLNMDYSPKVPVTLEFLQRYVYCMNPRTGHKRPTKECRNASSIVIHPKYTKLITAVEGFNPSTSSDSVSSAED